MHRYIESIAREEFGFRKVGEGNISESILAGIVKTLFPEETILRNQRPSWLGGLEIDIWIPELNIGIEYQGQQHYFPVQAWGGEKALRELKERDERKRSICQEKGIILVEVKYSEPLDADWIREKILKNMKYG